MKKRNSVIIAWSAALIWFAMYAYVPTLPAYAASIGADAAVIGIISGVYGLLQIVLRVPLGFISDRLGRDRLLLITGFAILCVSCIMFLAGKTVAWVVAARTTAGAAAAWWVIISASYARYQPHDRQVKGQGVLSAAANMGKMIAAAGCAFAAQLFGYEATFLVALCGAAAGLVLMFFLRRPEAEPIGEHTLKEQLALFRNRDLLAFSLLSLLSQMQCFAIPTTFAAVAAEHAGADSLTLGFLVVVFFVAVSVSSFFVGGKTYRKMGGIRVLAISFLIGAAGCIPQLYSSVGWIFAMQVLSGISYGIVQAELAGFVLQCVPPQHRGAATGIFQSLFAIGIFFGPVAAGMLLEYASFDAAYWTYAGICAGAAILCPVLIPKRYDVLA